MAKDKSGSSLVAYEPYTAEDAAEDAKAAKKARSGKLLKLEVGKTIVRFVPPRKGKKLFRVTYVHFVDVPGVGRVRIVCAKMEAKKPCVVCSRANQLLASGNAIDEKKADKLKPKRRVLSNVVDRGEEGFGPKIVEFGAMIENQLIAMRQDEDLGGDFVHPTEGCDIAIIRTGTGQNDTEYKVVRAKKGKPNLADDVKAMNEIIAGQHDLDREIKVPSVDEQEKLLRGEKGQGDDEDEDEEPRSRRKPSRSVDEEIEDAVIIEDEDD